MGGGCLANFCGGEFLSELLMSCFFCSLVPSSLSVGSPDLVHVDRNAEALPRRFVPLSWAACLPCLVRAKIHNGTVSLWGGWRVCELSGPLSFHSHPFFFAGLQPPQPSGRKCALHERMQHCPFRLSARVITFQASLPSCEGLLSFALLQSLVLFPIFH